MPRPTIPAHVSVQAPKLNIGATAPFREKVFMKTKLAIPALSALAVLLAVPCAFAQQTGVSHPEALEDNISAIPVQQSQTPAKPSPYVLRWKSRAQFRLRRPLRLSCTSAELNPATPGLARPRPTLCSSRFSLPRRVP